VTYRLGIGRLAVETKVSAPGPAALPFGLGFHPYIRIPFVTGGDPADYRVQCAARQFWKLTDNLPTGKRAKVDGPRDLRQPRQFSELYLDDVFTDLVPGARSIGAVLDHRHGVGLSLRADAVYRDVVVFTPAHREAVCLEPYTCPTDAINLQATTPDIGWQVLQPGAEWQATFAFEV
jgi:aldose 1-epimerase